MRTSKVPSLSLPPTLLRQAERAAKEEGRTKSELFREALRRYLQEREWRAIQQVGARHARRLGITEADVEPLISQHRKSKRR